MRRLLILPLLILAFAALFLRSYSLPPAPDRQGGTTVSLTFPNRALFGSPRGDCVGAPVEEPPIPCLIASVARARNDGFPLLQLPFCATCYSLSQRLAVIGRDEKAVAAKQAQIGRFGW